MMSSLPHFRPLAAAVSVALLSSLPSLPAFAEDAPPVDVAQILKQLKGLKDQQAQSMKTSKMKALQQAQAAASDPGKALEMWEEAVRMTQFAGVSRESSAFHDWKSGEGEALKEKECQAALHLYFSWLALTLQRASGSSVKDLLPPIINYTKEANADQAAMDGFEENVKREKELDSALHKRGNPRRSNDDQVKRLHDQIVKQPTTGSVVVQALQIADALNDAGSSKGVKGPDGVQTQAPTWEHSPGNVDGIFQKIVLPELRIEKDPRIVEYWDMKLKQEADSVTKSKLTFEADKFNQVRRPQLLWSRAQDVLAIGQKNRALGEMFKLVQTYPTHPDAVNWMSTLEQALLPPPVPATAGPGTAMPSAAVPGSAFPPGSAPASPAAVAGGQ
jgi:hypothetical protein